MTTQQPPPPLEWHPAYRDKTWLLDWLNGTGEFAHLHTLQVPFTPRVPLIGESDVTTASVRSHTLVRKKAGGLAPYVGRPFVYAWHIGVDELGRSIASDSRIVHLVEESIL